MQTVRKYVVDVANAVTGTRQDGFGMENTGEQALNDFSASALILYGMFLLALSTGAALLSYNYNRSVGTSSTLTVVYVILAFTFSSFYYPYYAFMLSPVQAKGNRR
jgi:hypothetical protein